MRISDWSSDVCSSDLSAETLRIRQGDLEGLPRGVLVYRDERWDADAFGVAASDEMSGPLGRDHAHVDLVGRDDLVEVDVEAVREEEIGRSSCRERVCK